LATNSIRGGANREVLKRIKETGDIFMAWSDEPWILAGAAVRISIIGFDDGKQRDKSLDGSPVTTVNSDLTASVDITVAKSMRENLLIGFQGSIKVGPFDIDAETANQWLQASLNVNGRANRDVLRPYANSQDLMRRSRDKWIVDFGVGTSMEAAAMYEKPFEYVRETVQPIRSINRDAGFRDNWWLHGRPRVAMRSALAPLDRFIATPCVSKYRIFVWLSGDIYPDHALTVFAREDDYFFGVLHSRAHEVWSLRMGTWLGKGNDPRYTPTTTFETFPLPWPPGDEPVDDPRVQAIAAAAKSLNELRESWLNPPDASEAELKKRTLTNLYNARPTWLANAHAALDRAVWAAYGWDDPEPATTAEDVILGRLLALNGERADRK
jgi:type II restriction/modification system DNA methylase subunit YeeA